MLGAGGQLSIPHHGTEGYLFLCDKNLAGRTAATLCVEIEAAEVIVLGTVASSEHRRVAVAAEHSRALSPWLQ